VCVCVCARARARTCVRVCVCYTCTRTHTLTHNNAPPCVGSRSQMCWWFGLAPATLEFWIPNERNQGKQTHPVLKYRVPHGSQAHFNAIGMPSQQSNSNSFRIHRAAAFYQALKSKVGLVVAKAAVLRINLNLEGCGVVAPPMHAPSRAPLLPPPSFTQSPSPPRSLVPVRDGQTSPHVTPHRPLLIVSHSKCPPLSPFPHANSFVICPAVISTHAKGGWQRTRGKWQPGAATLRCSSQAFFLQMGRAKQSGRPGETLASSSKTLSGNSCRFSRFFHFHDGGFRRPRTSGQADRLERLVQSDCAAPQKLRLGRGRRAGAGRDTTAQYHAYVARPLTMAWERAEGGRWQRHCA
jgi:hypothetical protein